MKLLCLMPTHGRRAPLLNNSLACFKEQAHEDKALLIYDDLGTLGETKVDCENVRIMSTQYRCTSVGEKYNYLLAFAHNVGLDYDAVVVWDDDDVYLPYHLTYHEAALQSAKWSKPSKIISAYFDPPKSESAAGRFHGSIAVWKDNLNYFIEKYGSAWIDTTRATFDQEFLQRCQFESTPNDPLDYGFPQYVYRWQTSRAGHCSGLMGSPTWYADYKPDSVEPIAALKPGFDADTLRIYKLLGY